MLFNSYEFIFIYLPILVFTMYLLSKFKNFNLTLGALVFFSLVFYAYWNPLYLLLLIPLAMINYYLAYWIIKISEKKYYSFNKILLIFGLTLDISVLCYFKYMNFFIGIYSDISRTEIHHLNIILPLGISFFIFQKIAYLIDAYRGEVKNKSLLNFLFFVSFFPQLIAGPIVHHKDIIPQLDNKDALKISSKNITLFITIFSIGLSKKILFADNISQFSSPIFNSISNGYAPNFLEAWIGALSYSMQIYFDFSGYCDMAIALGLLFGIKLPLNFNSPYKSLNIIDFWRRWHMTLSKFLRDYVYIILGGNKNGGVRRYINLFITMLVGGFWHGANWTFIIWGALHGLFLIVNHTWRFVTTNKKYFEFNNIIFKIFSFAITYLSVVIAWVFFRSENINSAIVMIKSMFLFNEISLPIGLAGKFQFFSQQKINFHGVTELGLQEAVISLVILHLIVFTMPNTQEIIGYYEITNKKSNIILKYLNWKPNLKWCLIMVILTMFTILKVSAVSEFIYFQF